MAAGAEQGLAAYDIRRRGLLTFPGASYLAGLNEIVKQKLSTTATVLADVGST
jgi:hypothetical protein